MHDRFFAEMRVLLPDPVQGLIAMPDLLQLKWPGEDSGGLALLRAFRTSENVVPRSCPLASGIFRTCVRLALGSGRHRMTWDRALRFSAGRHRMTWAHVAGSYEPGVHLHFGSHVCDTALVPPEGGK